MSDNPETPVRAAEPEAPEAAAAEAAPAGPPPGRDQSYWKEEARKAFVKREEARREALAARELAEKAAAEAAACQSLIAELVERKLAALPRGCRRLVPENLPAADRLRYLIANESLLAAAPGAAVPGPEKPAGGPADARPFAAMTFAERVELYRSDPERYRRLAADAGRLARPGTALNR